MSLRQDNDDKTAVWLNDQPAGALYQRPYMISFEEETPAMVSSYLHPAFQAQESNSKRLEPCYY